jgi:hypothetical protein
MDIERIEELQYDDDFVALFGSKIDLPMCEDGCWEWLGTIGQNEYGNIGKKIDGKHNTLSAHRFSWLLANNYWPPSDMHVEHTCDNTSCVNPDHLFLATPAANLQDSIDKGRFYTTGKKLTKDDVRQMRRLYQTGNYTQVDMADKFSISVRHARAVLNKEYWADV